MSVILQALEDKRPVEDVKKIIAANKDKVNQANRYGWTPLRLVVSTWPNDDEANELVKCLLDAGADQTIPAKKGGLCPLHEVMRGNSELAPGQILTETAKTLIARMPRERMDIRTSVGLTPLHYAAQNRNMEMVELLIESGCTPDAITDDGNTAAHYAGAVEARDVMNILIDHGCDPLQKNDNGWTCFGKLFGPEQLRRLADNVDLNAHILAQLRAVFPDKSEREVDDLQGEWEQRPPDWSEDLFLFREVLEFAKHPNRRVQPFH
ncbi:hypothetical protein PTSG_05108 [Salpingoeca rosetta]|uniref:Uncharacterized protein n=1 Tax=Salpingoeca rosetta (strain ATCC 50818 / BSB-021) TaxID=946362 RepID=F2UAJ5_SALR5|nr:uncharacterized protein PTSG_05108 [Salpingoeca rosetta]EGD73411.1 hypothetical protein PTSG_05108 [Salpingoeca rosetta]|eukprot:XP_004993693.1 hypothetical protein PTSG_05108 [Salpingoeca rosetta]